MKNKVELLAPAGNTESLYAAVLNGADAVYMGGSKFSARAYANNFDNETLKSMLDYCHLYDVKVYITINTLIKEEEVAELLEYAEYLYKIGVDAFIIQDIGIAKLIKSFLKDMEIHASTQMTIHNPEGALFLKEAGFKRIVLSRELGLKEIENISKVHNIETEIFVHGALCVCYSGQCLMSSLIGGRSGNRGRCAQPCRMPYSLVNKNTGEERSGYLLSPKDMCTLEDVAHIIESGTHSLKIEGRMKRPEYVAGVVSSYKKAIDSLSNEEISINFSEENKKLMKLFNREGFSKAYLFGNIGKDMMSYNNPKNNGIFIGAIDGDNSILLQEDIALGDGISCGENGFTISKIIHGNIDTIEAKAGDRVKLFPVKYNYRDKLYKTSDVNLLTKLNESYENIYLRKLSLNIKVLFKQGDPISLSTDYKGVSYKVEGEIVQVAKNKPMDKSRIEENLRKTGDTPFEIQDIEFISFEEGFVPVSAVNSLRRSLLEQILKMETDKHKRNLDSKIDFKEKYKAYVNSNSSKEAYKAPGVIVCVSTKEQLKAANDLGCEHVAIEVFKRNISINIEEVNATNKYLKIPNIIKQEFDTVCKYISDNLKNIQGIITANHGIIRKFSGTTKIIGDYKLNVFNSATARFFSDFIDVVPVSLELNKKEIATIAKQNRAELQMFIYGKPELMVSEYCSTGSVYGGKATKSSCDEPCKAGNFYLRDRKDEEFVIKNDVFCRSYIYNNVPINLIQQRKEIEKIGISSFRLDFIDEDYNETIRIIKSFLEGHNSLENGNYTRGHFKRGVE
jgi:putative protease